MTTLDERSGGQAPDGRRAASGGGLDAARLRAIPSERLAHFLAGRRWFGAKGTTVRRAAVHDTVPLRDGETTFAVARLEVELADGRVERYQLPLAVQADVGGAGAGSAADARVPTLELEDGTRLVDATHDPGFRRLLARGLAQGATHDGEGVRWVLQPLEGADLAGLDALPAKLGSAEQSNTSMILGDRAILKLYRKLEAGPHPDVEIARALTTRTGFRNTPALLGTVTFEDRDGATTVAGMLQALVAGARDAWEVALDAAREHLRGAGDAPSPFAGEMRELGRVTRALHDALASVRDEPGFQPRMGTGEDVDEWTRRARDMMHDSTELLAQARSAGRVRERDEAAADAVLRRRSELLGVLDALAAAVGNHPGERIRHHGDYHLGQVLKGADGRYMIIDFEGEPARLLAERRAPHSALRDVAGMLRSFAYAAASAAMEVGPDASTDVEGRSARWERDMRLAFVSGYQEAGAAPFLPADPEATAPLITLFEMEKVFYELAYELNNRPDWVWIPLRGIGQRLEGGTRS